jgi:hypothetical protein
MRRDIRGYTMLRPDLLRPVGAVHLLLRREVRLVFATLTESAKSCEPQGP